MTERTPAPASAEAVENLTDRITDRFEATGEAIRALELTIDAWGRKIDSMLVLVERQAIAATDAAIFAREARDRLDSLEAQIAEADVRERLYQAEARRERAEIVADQGAAWDQLWELGRRQTIHGMALMAALVLIAVLIWEFSPGGPLSPVAPPPPPTGVAATATPVRDYAEKDQP